MTSSPTSWRIVPYTEPSPIKRVRVRDDAQVRLVVRYLLADECVALLGPPNSEKSHLLHDVAAALAATGRFQPLYIDLWQTRSHDEASFFSSMAELLSSALGHRAPALSTETPDARALQRYLAACANSSDRGVALLIDHLQALPHDLVHGLLLALRAAYMEREADAPHSLAAVVAGGMNLVSFATGSTSPFNIAKPVVAGPLTEAQSRALAAATLAAYDCPVSARGLDRIVAWAGGDRYLVPQICVWAAETVHDYRRPLVTCSVVERAVERLWIAEEAPPPIRAAIRMIEEDPDTMLDVLHILDHGALARSHSRQTPTRTGADRLRLSGAVTLAEGCYTFTNLAYRRALAAHFTTDHVGHVLRIAGLWDEAIQHLAPRMAPAPLVALATVTAKPRRHCDDAAPADNAPRTTHHAPRTTQYAVRSTQDAARPQFLEAIVQSIYATDALDRAYELLAEGLRTGFGLPEIAIYRALPAQGHLVRAYPRAGPPPETVDLHDPTCVEAQTYHLGNYALRGTADEARLVVALASANQPIGVVTVEHFVRDRDPHDLPEQLPDLLHFLQHAGGALGNVILRTAYLAIGQAVLDSKALEPVANRVLSTVADAVGCDYAALYLVDDNRRGLELAAGVGQAGDPDWRALAHFPLSGGHPAVTALQERRMLTTRGSERSREHGLVERFGLHQYMRHFLPLAAGGDELGTLELGFAGSRGRTTDESVRTLAAFGDQVAIAVHNMQLLRRTDQALARKLAEISVGREIQLSLLPKSCPSVPGWDFAAVYQAARVVGGDFYDFCDLPGEPKRLGLVIADVADKGVPAALFMAVSRTIIRTVAFSGRGPSAALIRANQLILNDSQAELFLSAIYAVLDLEAGSITYANAGHNRPLWYHAADGSLTELDQRGIVLGAFEEITLGQERIDLAPGDVLVFFTDGVTDALNAQGEDFGDDRLRQVILAHARGSAQEVLWAITGAVAGFVGETEQADDVTGVVVRWG